MVHPPRDIPEPSHDSHQIAALFAPENDEGRAAISSRSTSHCALEAIRLDKDTAVWLPHPCTSVDRTR
jgi:hypothetical protein